MAIGKMFVLVLGENEPFPNTDTKHPTVFLKKNNRFLGKPTATLGFSDGFGNTFSSILSAEEGSIPGNLAPVNAFSPSNGDVLTYSAASNTWVNQTASVGSATVIQSGLNTYTGGTASAPTVNISAATLNSLSSTTISGATIFSGATNLYNVFSNSEILGYNVTLSGLTGNGSTDNSSALQSLVNTVSAGSTLYFPPGTYIINSEVTYGKKLHLKGSNAILKTTSNDQIFVLTTGGEDSTFDGLIFSGNSTGANQYAIYFNGCGKFIVTRCSFFSLGGGGVAATNIENSVELGGNIINCKFISNNIGVDLFSRGEYVNISNNTFIANTKAIQTAAGNFTISSNNINYNTTGIEVITGANNGHGIISNNNLNHNSVFSLNIHDTTLGTTISNNHIYQGIVAISATTGVKILGGQLDAVSYNLNTNTDLELNGVFFVNSYSNTLTVVGTSPTFFRCTGTLPTGAVNNCGGWVDYSATSTLVGWSSTSTKIIKYTIVGKVAMVEFAIQGTSNSTTTSFTIPLTNANVCSKARGCYAANNSAALSGGGVAWMNSNSSTVTIYTDWALNSNWTASGNKHIVGMIELEIA